MDKTTKKAMLDVLWSIHDMFNDINHSDDIDAEQVDLLEQEIKILESLL